MPRRALFLRIAPFILAKIPHPRDLMWPIQALNSAAMLRRHGVPARVVDTWQRPASPDQLLDRIIAERPDLLLLETRTPTASLTLELARRALLRLPGLVIWGIGQHPSERPEDFLFEGSPFSGCLSGEMEPVITRIADGDTEIDGTIVWDEGTGEARRIGSRAQLEDCDAVPILDPGDLELSRYRMLSLHVPTFRRPRWGYLMTSRGCGFECIFCSPTLRQSYGTRFRGQSPERVAEEMDFLARRHGITALYAIDDLFSGRRKRVHQICDAILARGVKVQWTVQTRLDHLNEDLLRHMQAAGCVGIKVGVETGNQRVSEIIKKRLDRDKAIQMAEVMRKVGINLTACYMVGSPTETLDEMEETFTLARRLGALMIQIAFHTPYPGSESYERYAESHEVADRSHFDGKPVNLSAVSDEELVRFHRDFYLRYYLSPPQVARYVRHRAVYRLFQADELELAVQTGRYLFRQALARGGPKHDHHHPLEA